MDVSKEQPQATAGLYLGDKYSYLLCLIDQHSGEVIEEGRLCTSPEAFRRRFCSERQLRMAIETGTHSPWASRVLEECGHEVLVAYARKLRLIYDAGLALSQGASFSTRWSDGRLEEHR